MAQLPDRMKFGIFLGPFHQTNENPTLAIHRDMEKWVFEKHEFEKNEKLFDKSVANAMSNANVEMSIKQNKS